MSNFYTNVAVIGNNVVVRGVENGKRFTDRIEFQPTLYHLSKNPTDMVNLSGQYVGTVNAGTISDTRDYIRQYDGTHGFTIYGNTSYAHQYISDTYQHDISWDIDQIKIYNLDIETTTEYGFPKPNLAREEITLISIKDKVTKNITTFGIKPYDNNTDKVTYIHCQDETRLLKEFLIFWQSSYPDIITGWNIDYFDITYLVNRINSILGKEYSKKLSPWGKLRENYKRDGSDEDATAKQEKKDREVESYTICGISTMDYLKMYKKAAWIPTRETYKLDHIATVELGEGKLENPGETFKDFYTHYWQTFVDYNIRDADLVDRLEDKLKLLEMNITLAYMAKVNYEEVFSPVGMWDTIIYNHLRENGIVIPPKPVPPKSKIGFEGAYVKDPICGRHKNVASFDLQSLYPHLIMQYNISPETLTNIRYDVTVDKLLNQELDLTELVEKNLAITANGWCYSRDKIGFLPELMAKMYSDRSKYKKQQLKIEQEYEITKDAPLQKEISRLTNLQMALKIALNSLYGALGQKNFRYFDLRMAEGITLSGQLSIRWIAGKINNHMNKLMKTENVDYVIAIDTDSNYVSLERFINHVASEKSVEYQIKLMDKFCTDNLQPNINKWYQELADYMNAYEQKMIMKREVLADKGIFVAKKRYILNVHNSEGVQYAKPKLKVMGLEMVRSSTPAIVREKLKEIIQVILDDDESRLHQFIEKFRQEFYTYDAVDIAKPSGVNNLDAYSGEFIYTKGTPIHVRGALLYNHHLKRLNLDKKYPLISEGDKLKFVYISKPNIFHEDIIAFPSTLPTEFKLEKYIDYEKQFDVVFLKAVSIIIDAIGWELFETSSLEEFFA